MSKSKKDLLIAACCKKLLKPEYDKINESVMKKESDGVLGFFTDLQDETYQQLAAQKEADKVRVGFIVEWITEGANKPEANEDVVITSVLNEFKKLYNQTGRIDADVYKKGVKEHFNNLLTAAANKKFNCIIDPMMDLVNFP